MICPALLESYAGVCRTEHLWDISILLLLTWKWALSCHSCAVTRDHFAFYLVHIFPIWGFFLIVDFKLLFKMACNTEVRLVVMCVYEKNMCVR